MNFHGFLPVEGEPMPRQYYAHSLEGKPPEEWQPLAHCLDVAVVGSQRRVDIGG